MPMFDELNPLQTITDIQEHLSSLIKAFEDLEDDFKWASAYTQADFEAPPLAMSANGSQDILNALADANDLWQTANGTSGWPTAPLPYNFTASMRAVMGSRLS